MTSISLRVELDDDGELFVRVAPEFRPIDEFLQYDVSGDADSLNEIVKNLNSEHWSWGGDSCWLTIKNGNANIKSQFSDVNVTLSSSEFRTVLSEFRARISELENQ